MINDKYIRLPNGNYIHHSYIQNTRKAAKLEPNIRDESLAKKEVQRPTSKRVLIRVTSFRKRLIDQDNLCEKYHVDLCRYSGAIASDAPDKCKIEVGQIKSKEEYTQIEITEEE